MGSSLLLRIFETRLSCMRTLCRFFGPSYIYFKTCSPPSLLSLPDLLAFLAIPSPHHMHNTHTNVVFTGNLLEGVFPHANSSFERYLKYFYRFLPVDAAEEASFKCLFPLPSCLSQRWVTSPLQFEFLPCPSLNSVGCALVSLLASAHSTVLRSLPGPTPPKVQVAILSSPSPWGRRPPTTGYHTWLVTRCKILWHIRCTFCLVSVSELLKELLIPFWRCTPPGQAFCCACVRGRVGTHALAAFRHSQPPAYHLP